jgi:hypothetical protein
VERNGLLGKLIGAAGTVGFIYVVGAVSLSLRYDGFGLPGQQAAAQTPREVLLAAGLRTLILWALIGVAVLLALRAIPDRLTDAAHDRLREVRGLAWVAVIALVLLFTLDVWWPLAAYGAMLAVVFVEGRRPRAGAAVRGVVGALAIGAIAVAYEADRLSYKLEWTCVSPGQTCGLLVGQQDRGFYLGTPGLEYRLTFIPSNLVQRAESTKQLRRVIPSRGDARRKRLIERLIDIRVR